MPKMPIAEYLFEGPYPTSTKIESEGGVFAIISKLVDKYYLLDVGYSEDLKKSIQEHNRKKCWEKYRKGKLRYAVLYEKDFSNQTNEEVERKIRLKYKTIPCGKNQGLADQNNLGDM
jgi:hypothetical protein